MFVKKFSVMLLILLFLLFNKVLQVQNSCTDTEKKSEIFLAVVTFKSSPLFNKLYNVDVGRWGFQSEGTKIFSKYLDKRYNEMLQSNESGCIRIEPIL